MRSATSATRWARAVVVGGDLGVHRPVAARGHPRGPRPFRPARRGCSVVSLSAACSASRAELLGSAHAGDRRHRAAESVGLSRFATTTRPRPPRPVPSPPELPTGRVAGAPGRDTAGARSPKRLDPGRGSRAHDLPSWTRVHTGIASAADAVGPQAFLSATVVQILSAVVKPSATTSFTFSGKIACGSSSTDLTCCLVSVSSTEPVAARGAGRVALGQRDGERGCRVGLLLDRLVDGHALRAEQHALQALVGRVLTGRRDSLPGRCA